MRPILLLIFMVLISIDTLASIPPWPSYCEHQGYTYDSDEESCIFSEKPIYDYDPETGGEVMGVNVQKCDARAFLNGTCGSEYVQEIPCRQQGEPVFPRFEECCAGLDPRAEGFGQATCEKLGFFEKMWRWLTSLF